LSCVQQNGDPMETEEPLLALGGACAPEGKCSGSFQQGKGDSVDEGVVPDPCTMNRWLAFADPVQEAAFVASQRITFVRNYRLMTVAGVVLNLTYVGFWGLQCYVNFGRDADTTYCLYTHTELATSVGASVFLLLTVPLARRTWLTDWVVPNLMIVALGVNMRQAIYLSATQTKAAWPGPDSPWYKPDVTRLAMVASEQSVFLFWQALYMCFLVFLLSAPFTFRQTTQMSLTALASFLWMFFDISRSPVIPDWNETMNLNRFPAILPLFMLSLVSVGLVRRNETTKRQEFAGHLERQALEATISAQKIEKERTLRHEAEYRLEFEKKLTNFVCSELRVPFSTMQSASRFVVTGLQQARQSSVPPVDWSSKLGSILEWCVPITESSAYVSDFLANVLDLSRIEEGNLQLSDEPVYLAPIADRVKERVHGALMERQQKVQFKIDIDPSLCVTGDAARIEQVLTILAESALERTAVGFVQLSARVTQDIAETTQLLLEVADTGTGISAEQVPFLFVRRPPGMQSACPPLPSSRTRELCDQFGTSPPVPAQSAGRSSSGKRVADALQRLEERSRLDASSAAHAQQLENSSGLGLVLAHQIVRLWGSSAGLQVCSPAWTQEQRVRSSDRGRLALARPPAAAAAAASGRRLQLGPRGGPSTRRLEVYGPGSIFSFQVPIAVLSRQPMSEGAAAAAVAADRGPETTSSSAPVSEPAPATGLSRFHSSSSSSTSDLSSPSHSQGSRHRALQEATQESEV
jgi:signal transduction histidine kinase